MALDIWAFWVDRFEQETGIERYEKGKEANAGNEQGV
jgi:hypothetical protein